MKTPLLYLLNLTCSPTFFLHGSNWASSTCRLLADISVEFLISSSVPCSSPTESASLCRHSFDISFKTVSTLFFCSFVCPSPLTPQDFRNSRNPLGLPRLSADFECSLQNMGVYFCEYVDHQDFQKAVIQRNIAKRHQLSLDYFKLKDQIEQARKSSKDAQAGYAHIEKVWGG